MNDNQFSPDAISSPGSPANGGDLGGRQAEQVPRNTEDRYRTLVENIHLGITLIDEQYRIVAVNSVHATMVGKPVDGCLGQECFRVFEKREAVCPHCPGAQAMKTGKPAEAETTGVRHDGTTYSARVQAFPVRGSDGRPEGFIEIVEDITDRKKEQDALRQANFCVQQASDSIFWLDPDGKFIFANQKTCEILGYSSQELLAMTVFDINPTISREWWRPHWKEIQDKKSFVIETSHRTKSGRVFPVEVNVNHMTVDGREYDCAFARDISERKKAETQLAHFSAIVDSSQDAIYAADLDGLVTSWNPGAERIYGYKAEEMIGRPVSTLATPSRSGETTKLLARIADGGYLERYDTVRRCQDGTLVDVSITLSPIKDGDGKIIGASAIAHDITNRKRAEEVIRQSEERLANIVDNAAEGIYTMSLDGVLTFVSPAWTEKLGFDASEVEGRSFVPLVHPDDAQVCHDALKRILATGTPQDATYRIRHKDGSWRCHHSVGSLVKDRSGHPAGFVGVAEDVTERLYAEEMLRASEEKYRSYINNSPTAVFVTDSIGRFVEVNAAACRLLGYPAEELTQMGIPDILTPEYLPAAMTLHQEALHKGLTTQGQLCFVRKDGSRVFMSVDAVKVQGDRVIGFCLDITERINAEESLKQSSEALRQANLRLEEACGKAEAAEQEVRKSRDLLQSVIDGIGSPIMVIDRNYQIVLANRTVRQFTGGIDPVVNELKCHQVSHRRETPCEGQHDPCPLNLVLASGRPEKVIHRHFDFRGEESTVEVTATPLIDDNNEIRHVIESCYDITELKRVETELRTQSGLPRPPTGPRANSWRI